jgi:tetratricopeptide (TPR) repeat protein
MRNIWGFLKRIGNGVIFITFDEKYIKFSDEGLSDFIVSKDSDNEDKSNIFDIRSYIEVGNQNLEQLDYVSADQSYSFAYPKLIHLPQNVLNDNPLIVGLLIDWAKALSMILEHEKAVLKFEELQNYLSINSIESIFILNQDLNRDAWIPEYENSTQSNFAKLEKQFAATIEEETVAKLCEELEDSINERGHHVSKSQLKNIVIVLYADEIKKRVAISYENLENLKNSFNEQKNYLSKKSVAREFNMTNVLSDWAAEYLNIGQIQLATDKLKLAEEYFRKIPVEKQDQRDYCIILMRMAMVDQANLEFNKALEKFEILYRQWPGNNNLKQCHDSRLATVFLNWGDLCYTARRTDDAIKKYEQAQIIVGHNFAEDYRFDADRIKVLMSLSTCYNDTLKYNEAFSCYNEALKIASSSINEDKLNFIQFKMMILSNRANLYIKQQEYNKARHDLENAINIIKNPRFNNYADKMRISQSSIFCQLGLIYSLIGDHKKASNSFMNANGMLPK